MDHREGIVRTARRLGMVIAAGLLGTLAVAPASVAATPDLETYSFHEVLVAPRLTAECGFTVTRDITGRGTIIGYADGSVLVAATEVDIWTANGKSATERDAYQYHIGADGSAAVTGADYHILQPHTGVLVVDTGRVAIDPDGNVVMLAGLHPIVLDGYDRGPWLCPALAP